MEMEVARHVVGNETGLDILPDDDVIEVYEDWMDVYYAPMPDWCHNCIGAILLLTIYIGTHGNLATIFIFLSTGKLRTPQNMFLLNLAVVDLLTVLACQPVFCYASFLKHYPINTCHVFGSLSTFGGLCSINSMAAIAFDRYAMVCFQHQSQPKTVTPSFARSFRLIAFVWAYSLIFAILPNVGVGRFHLNGSGTSCTFDYISRDWNNRFYLLFMYICGFFLPLGICIYCYVMLFRTVHVSAQKHEHHNQSHGKEISVARACVLCIGVFLITWTPYAVVGVVGQIAGGMYLGPYSSTLPALLAKTNCIYNPIIFAFTHPCFKKELKRRLAGP